MIYIVEDNVDIREMESYALQNSGYSVMSFENSVDFFLQCQKDLPELVILDVMLPGDDGLTILKKLRDNENTKAVPVMMLTAKSTEVDKVKGLDGGADDYMTKPFGVMEFVSRVKALLRRTQKDVEKENKLLSVGGIVIDDIRRVVTANEKVVELTFKEYELLKCFIQNKGIVLSRDKLLDTVWGYNYIGETRTVDIHIKTLRQKLGECGKEIITVRNVGYKLGE